MRNKGGIEVKNGGIGFCGLLTIAFVVLKLTHYIEWSWLWVLSPIWLPVAITFAALVVSAVVIFILTVLAE